MKGMRLELLGSVDSGSGSNDMSGLEDILNIVTKVSTSVNNVSKIVNGINTNVGSQTYVPVYQPPVIQQTQLTQPLPEEDNTLLYIGLGVGGSLLLAGGIALVLKKRKKARGMGRVRKIKAKSRKPIRAKRSKRKTRKRAKR